MVRELLSDPGEIYKPRNLLALPEFIEKCNSPEKINTLVINEKELSRISSLSTPNKALMEINIPNYSWSVSDIEQGYSFYLENIQDPGNLGTIIRTADWFGIRNIFLSEESVDIYNPKVIQSTMGSFARVKVHYIKPDKFFQETERLPPSYLSIATTLDGENIYKTKLGTSGIFLFGNESHGLSKKISDHADIKISIPGSSDNKGAESLNLSTAVGIIGAEIIRRRTIQNGN